MHYVWLIDAVVWCRETRWVESQDLIDWDVYYAVREEAQPKDLVNRERVM